ncbi:MAG: hypothetical protein WAQ28_20565 [Bacteroidia bacterium]|jgi:hypothetical protein
MSILKKIKQTIANGYLKLELKDHVREQKPNKFNFAQCKTVGILFDAASPEDFELVKRYVLYLREHRKKVKVLGFYPSKRIPDMTYSKLEYDFFSAKELNWFGKPSAMVVQNFIGEEYDLLLDLNINDHFALKYVSALSKAVFKVGKYNEKDIEMYDMMIDSDNTKTLKYFLRQVDIYITMLNKVEPNLN